MERVAAVYRNIRSRQDIKAWEKLFADDCFLSLEEEENCRFKLLRFIMDHSLTPEHLGRIIPEHCVPGMPFHLSLQKRQRFLCPALFLQELRTADLHHGMSELCWCYLQDGKIARGIMLAAEIEKKLRQGQSSTAYGSYMPASAGLCLSPSLPHFRQ